MTFSSKAIAASALLILVGIATLSFWSEVRNEKDRQWVIHTLLVVEKLQTIRIDITQAEPDNEATCSPDRIGIAARRDGTDGGGGGGSGERAPESIETRLWEHAALEAELSEPSRSSSI